MANFRVEEQLNISISKHKEEAYLFIFASIHYLNKKYAGTQNQLQQKETIKQDFVFLCIVKWTGRCQNLIYSLSSIFLRNKLQLHFPIQTHIINNLIMIASLSQQTATNKRLMQCPICFLEYNCEINPPIMVCLSKHTICFQCLKMLQKPQNCPFCRQLIDLNQTRVNRKLYDLLPNQIHELIYLQQRLIYNDKKQGIIQPNNTPQKSLSFDFIFMIMGMLTYHIPITIYLIQSAILYPQSACMDHCFMDVVSLRTFLLYQGILQTVLSLALLLIILMKLRRYLRTTQFLWCCEIWVRVVQLKLLVFGVIEVLVYLRWIQPMCQGGKISTYSYLLIIADLMILLILNRFSSDCFSDLGVEDVDLPQRPIC